MCLNSEFHFFVVKNVNDNHRCVIEKEEDLIVTSLLLTFKTEATTFSDLTMKNYFFFI